MNDATNNHDFWETTASVMIRCFWIWALCLAFYFIFMAFGGDVIYKYHSIVFEMTRQQFDVIHYCGMIVTKLIALIPLTIFLSIKWAKK